MRDGEARLRNRIARLDEDNQDLRRYAPNLLSTRLKAPICTNEHPPSASEDGQNNCYRGRAVLCHAQTPESQIAGTCEGALAEVLEARTQQATAAEASLSAERNNSAHACGSCYEIV
jgi:hypothetical protein